MNWLDIGALEDIPRRGARLIRTKLGCVAVFRTARDEVFALDDKCPHKGGPLSEGIVHGDAVTCPLHNWVFSLESGQSVGPDEGRVNTYAVRVVKGRLQVDSSQLSQERAA